MENYSKLLFAAFIVLIIGLSLIQSIGDDVELAKIGSITVTNETLTFTSVTTDISNETITLTADNTTGTTTYDDLTILTALRNSTTSTTLIGQCNVTLSSGDLKCNATGSDGSVIYADYTYISTRTDTLAHDEIISLDAVRNASAGSNDYVATCDIILSTGFINCTNPHDGTTGYADYKWEPDTYVHSASARTALTLTVLFFALAILAIAVGFGWKSFIEGKLI